MAERLSKDAWIAKRRDDFTVLANQVIAEIFRPERVSDFVTRRLFLMPKTVPSMSWSPLNQFVCFVGGTDDARGYRQWQNVGRQVNKGASALHIFVPCFYGPPRTPGDPMPAHVDTPMQTDPSDITDKTPKAGRVAFFKLVPVFRVQDTTGQPLDYETELAQAKDTVDFTQFPLHDVATALGVTFDVSLTQGRGGYYDPSKRRIVLCTDAERTFFHELAHAIDHHYGAIFTRDAQEAVRTEVTAELCAAYFAQRYGKTTTFSFSQQYIENHVASLGGATGALQFCSTVLNRVTTIIAHVAHHYSVEASPPSFVNPAATTLSSTAHASDPAVFISCRSVPVSGVRQQGAVSILTFADSEHFPPVSIPTDAIIVPVYPHPGDSRPYLSNLAAKAAQDAQAMMVSRPHDAVYLHYRPGALFPVYESESALAGPIVSPERVPVGLSDKDLSAWIFSRATRCPVLPLENHVLVKESALEAIRNMGAILPPSSEQYSYISDKVQTPLTVPGLDAFRRDQLGPSLPSSSLSLER